MLLTPSQQYRQSDISVNQFFGAVTPNTPLNLDLDAECFSFNYLEDSSIAQAENVKYKLALFGSLDWPQVAELEAKLTQNNSYCLVSKPNELLSGALVFTLTNALSSEKVTEVRQWAEQQQVELAYTENAPVLSKPGVLVMDMDSTAITIECIDEIAKLAGVGEQVAQVTAAAMRGELDFAESLRARVKTLIGAPVSVIDQVADNLPLMPGLENLVKVMKQHNWIVVIASGGFTYMTESLKRQLGLDLTVANELQMADGKLTGEVSGRIVDAQVKADTVVEVAQQHGIAIEQTIAMGDGANDLVMMAAAGLGVAFHAKPLVRAKADVSVSEGGLDQLLYLL